MRSLAISLLLLVALGTSVVVAGCGGDDVNFDAAVAQAADNTVAADGMRVAVTTTFDGQEVRGEGFQDLEGRKGELSMDLPGVGRFDIVTDDLVLYMRLPKDAGAELPDGKEWLRVDLRKALSQSGVDIDALMNIGGTDPTQLHQLKAIGDVDKVGTEEVRGAQTTHYRGTLDLRKVPGQVPPDQRKTVRRTIDKLIEQTGGDAEIPVELWIGSDDRVHRLRETIPSPADGDVEMTIDYYDFGARERVEVPDRDDTADLTDVAASALS